jgi:hypothetical protein
VQLIKKYKSIETGELYTTVTLKLEPENPFDQTAVMGVALKGKFQKWNALTVAGRGRK